jgi:hypothetical protein
MGSQGSGNKRLSFAGICEVGCMKHQRVRIKSFNGSSVSPPACKESENYWRLIGELGTVVAPKNERSRYLVKFDVSVAGLGLHCHNPIENSLWIHGADLQWLA